jgi:hypothetical protein
MTYDIATLRSLKERVEKATGADRTMDLEIAKSIVPDVIVLRREGDINVEHTYCEYTSSLDACVSLAGRVLPGSGRSVRWSDGFAAAAIQPQAGDLNSPLYTERSSLPSLAFLSAILAALIAQEEGQ